MVTRSGSESALHLVHHPASVRPYPDLADADGADHRSARVCLELRNLQEGQRSERRAGGCRRRAPAVLPRLGQRSSQSRGEPEEVKGEATDRPVASVVLNVIAISC